MYSIKEKMKLLRELLNPEHAEADLRLLRETSPLNDLLCSPIVNAARSAEKILYALLDQTTAEKIRLNRRAAECKKQPENEQNNENNKEKRSNNTDSEQPAAQEHTERKTLDNPGKDNPDGDTDKIDVTRQLEETQEELESTQSELEETQETLEDTQAELDATKVALEAEKKSEPATNPVPEKAKKKTSTRRSTGKTSSTKTSRLRR